MHRFVLAAVAFGGIALSTGACRTGTAYTPRTRGRAALAMVNGEPGIYKDGQLQRITAASMAVSCSAPAGTAAAAAANHHADYKRNASLAGVMYALGVFAPPMYALGGYFGAKSAVAQQHSHASEIDAINLHNDDAGCL
jgi:hypothetical protein